MEINSIALVVGLIFSPIGALMAFLITYDEYQHHFSGKKEPLTHAIQAAVITLVVFAIISFVIGLVMNSVVQQ